MADIKRLFDRQPSRKELLKTGGDFTVAELREFGLGEEKQVGGNTGRELLYVDDIIPVRLIPNSLLSLAEETFRETNDIGAVIESLWTSFYVYRDCVNKELEVPLVKKGDDSWEWPEPTDFSWGDENTKTLALMMGAYKRQAGPVISVTEGDTVHRLDVLSGVISEEKASGLIAQPENHIKYKIPALQDVRMINQQAWQMHALRNWAGHAKLMTAFDDLINQSLNRQNAEVYFTSMIEWYQQNTLDFPVVRYANKGETRSMSNLYILEF